MSDWFEFQARKLAPKDVRARALEPDPRPAPAPSPKEELTSEMIVEEGLASETFIGRLKRFWNP